MLMFVVLPAILSTPLILVLILYAISTKNTIHCTKRGTEINEAYASETYYGLYIPDSTLPAMSNETDLAAAKLIQDEHGTITQEEWKEGDEGRFIYGIIAKETK